MNDRVGGARMKPADEPFLFDVKAARSQASTPLARYALVDVA